MSLRKATISAMRATATSSLTATVANTVFVDTVGDYFQFKAGSTSALMSNVVVASSDGLGQYHRMGIPNQGFLAAAFWAVDPANSTGRANDENAGWGATQAAADLVPLRSFHELNRRLVGAADVTRTIHVLSGSDSTNFCVLTNLASNPGAVNYTTLIGDLIPVDASATGRVIASRVVAVPSTNTERTITITGLGLVPQYVGMLVMTANGGKTAVVTRQPSSGVLAVSQPRSCNPLTGDFGSVVDFAAADVVGFYDATSLPDYPFPPNFPKYPIVARVRIDLGTSGVFQSGHIGGSQVSFLQCIIGSDSSPAAVTLISANSNQDQAPTVICCSIRKRRVHFVGSWYFASSAVCLNGVGTNGGDGPRLSSTTIYLGDEFAIAGSGHSMVADGGPVAIVPTQGAQIASFGLDGAAFLLGLNSVTHPIRGAVLDATNPLIWYGTNPAIVPSNALNLLTIGRGFNRVPYDATKLSVTVGGSGKRISILGTDTSKDFSDAPFSTAQGVFFSD